MLIIGLFFLLLGIEGEISCNWLKDCVCDSSRGGESVLESQYRALHILSSSSEVSSQDPLLLRVWR